MDVKFYEIVFANDYSIAIKALRKPTPEEAFQFTHQDNPWNSQVVGVLELSESEVRDFYDCSRIEYWPIFG